MPTSNFHNDLSKEEILGGYLDKFYSDINSEGFAVNTKQMEIFKLQAINKQSEALANRAKSSLIIQQIKWNKIQK